MVLFQLTSAIQPFIALLNDSVETATTNVTHNATVSTTPFEMPSSFSSLITFIYSFSALRDYLKLIVLGGALDTLRRLYAASYHGFIDRLFVTATFDSEDFSFQWMMFWLSSLPQFRQFRDFTVSTSSFCLEDESLECDSDVDEEMRRRTRPVRYLPSYSSSYKMWYKGRYMTITRSKEESRWWTDKSTLEITIFTRDRSVLDSLIMEARQKWMSARSDKIDIFASEGFTDDWKHVASRPKRPLNSIVLDEGLKELVLEDARDFLKSKQWYADRGIPFRRGYLLYGAPGSGKTSIIHSLAGELGLDIYIISLSKNGLDDSTLNSLISSLPEQCIAIMEDIDAAFTHGLTRDTAGTELENPRNRNPSRQGRDDPEDRSNDRQGQGRGQGPGESPASRITLSGLLNALDGISAQEGRLLFATTNRYHSLDPALTRPGRMDLHVEFRLASRYQARELYERFYVPDAPENATGEVVKDEEEEEDEASSDSGYVTPTKEDSDSTPLVPKAVGSDEPPKYSGIAHSARAPKLSKKRIARLAEQFCARIPERELSMASLQGYLMCYKSRPFQAVDDVERWVKETQDAQDRKAKAEARVAAIRG
ncbi:P-loop containing nucleoside triphosphate hydrolase protein [Russula earlei]|uniref:P-loop containing nucleoside triphosphate hydrolase protein n=1 Tax=Russula earlei TaxID=71964 RepID=A0ACC0U345_9AGAM|nr:P-loop containing nucleoside triphosphate hydrolase protein [Russula earlei]